VALPVNTDNVNDMGQFVGLRAAARQQDPAALKAAARQFEALFTQQLFKSMRAAKVGDDLLGSDEGSMYQDMFDQQMAQHLSQGRGLGIADLLVRQLQQSKATKPDASSTGASASTTTSSTAATGSSVLRALSTSNAQPPLRGLSAADIAKLTSASTSGSSTAPLSDSLPPVQFIKNLLPQAEAAAKELGIPARTLVAQAALETGWGKHQMKNADGTPSYNFFGIKAGSNWSGDKVTKHTTEYAQGSAQTQVATFRSYSSPAEAFKDYVAFIKSNPRYATALQHGGDGGRYADGLQKAGYATDPAYAHKIRQIAGGPLMIAATASSSGTAVA
jgi:flagellar protein FlgJ